MSEAHFSKFEQVDAAELQPPSRARAPEVEGQELLPPRVRVDSPALRTKPEAETAKKEEGERWAPIRGAEPADEGEGEGRAPSLRGDEPPEEALP